MAFTTASLGQKAGKPHFSEVAESHMKRESELGEPPFLVPGPMLTPKLHIVRPILGFSSSQSYIIGEIFLPAKLSLEIT